ncbi:PHP domain-containing protein [Candidatus Poribacteria bacterium]|nr:PHP domain-containing protein [Candidatus Poribacteria bacterium]
MMNKHLRINKYADLHLHTSFSDGTMNPEQLVKEASRLGFSAIAITDHDNLDGIELAISAGKKYGIAIIPGVELSAIYNEEEIHVLGFYIDWLNSKLQGQLLEFRERRVTRAKEMVDKLKNLGVYIEYGDVLKLADSKSVGRPHVAAALVEKGHVSNTSEAFIKYLSNGGPAYIQKKKLSPEDAFAMILNSGGVPVLAHPGMIQEDIIPDLIPMGLMGLEAFHPYHNIYVTNYFCELAKYYRLLITGGSDCHGEAKGKMFLGNIKLPYEHVKALENARDYILEKLESISD